MIFYDNGVDITGLDGIDNGNSCNGFYAYDIIVSRGGWISKITYFMKNWDYAWYAT